MGLSPSLIGEPRVPLLPLPDEIAKLQVRDLSVCYGRTRALDHVTLNIPAQHITAFIGPSGCGKSTFLRCLNRMNDLVADVRVTGEVFLDGEDILAKATDPVEIRRRVGMVFQHQNPFPMSVFDNIAYGPRCHGLRSREALQRVVESALRQAALWDEVKDKLCESAFTLSGGQQQRLCIARTLAIEPEVLLLDEPSSALDPTSTSRIEELLLALKAHYTIIIVTHNMHQAARVADYTGFFLHGALVEFHPTIDVFERPVDHRTDEYVRGRFG